MRALLPVLSMLWLVAGCTAPVPEPLAREQDASAAAMPPPGPVAVEWKGHVVVSDGENLAHRSATEPLVAPLYAEGFLFDIQQPPRDFQVDLTWTGPDTAQMMIMLHAPHGKAGYREWVTEMASAKSQCIKVAPEELEPGHWQVMVHSRDAVHVEFTLTVTTIGGQGAIMDGDPHGHALDEQFNIEEGTPLPCEAPA
jgi:hypothetical protein